MIGTRRTKGSSVLGISKTGPRADSEDYACVRSGSFTNEERDKFTNDIGTLRQSDGFFPPFLGETDTQTECPTDLTQF